MSDLTKPEHVPSCVSTGEGVTVPTPAPTPRTMEQIAQECAEKVCHEGCLLDRGVACELIATAIAQAAELADLRHQHASVFRMLGIPENDFGELENFFIRAADTRAERDALRAEVERLTKERDDWAACAKRTDAKMLHEQADHNKTVDRLIECRAALAAAQQDKERLLCALNDATTSLCTLAQQSGRTEEMRELSQIRGYAFSRYSAAIDAARAREGRP